MSICEKTEICHFFHIIHNIILLLQGYTDFFFCFTSKNYTALLTESFRMSVTYLKTRTQQIANQPSSQ